VCVAEEAAYLYRDVGWCSCSENSEKGETRLRRKQNGKEEKKNGDQCETKCWKVRRRFFF